MYFEDVAEGQEILGFTREITLVSMAMYAGATWDFHRFHYDRDFVQARGHPAPFVDGQMIGALLARLLVDWAGPDAFVRHLSYRLRAMVYPGDRLTGRGVVTAKRREDGGHLVICALSIENQAGVAIVSGASAVVDLPARDR